MIGDIWFETFLILRQDSRILCCEWKGSRSIDFKIKSISILYSLGVHLLLGLVFYKNWLSRWWDDWVWAQLWVINSIHCSITNITLCFSWCKNATLFHSLIIIQQKLLRPRLMSMLTSLFSVLFSEHTYAIHALEQISWGSFCSPTNLPMWQHVMQRPGSTSSPGVSNPCSWIFSSNIVYVLLRSQRPSQFTAGDAVRNSNSETCHSPYMKLSFLLLAAHICASLVAVTGYKFWCCLHG